MPRAVAPDTDGRALGARLVTLRRAHDLTQERAAQRLGVTTRTVCGWEGGETIPRVANREALAALYGGEPSDYLPVPAPTPARLSEFERRLRRVEAIVGVSIY